MSKDKTKASGTCTVLLSLEWENAQPTIDKMEHIFENRNRTHKKANPINAHEALNRIKQKLK